MKINYTFVHQFRPIKSVYFKENDSLATNEFKLFLSKKHNLNMSLYNIFYKKKKTE